MPRTRSDRSKYRGFIIQVRSYRLTESGLWTGELDIRRHGRWQPFRVDERYRTDQEACAKCSDLGRRIIDGKVPGWSVDHLRGARPGRRAFRHAAQQAFEAIRASWARGPKWFEARQ